MFYRLQLFAIKRDLKPFHQIVKLDIIYLERLAQTNESLNTHANS